MASNAVVRKRWAATAKEVEKDVSEKKKTTKLRGLSRQANYADWLSDRRLSAKLVPTLADRGCRVVSATIPPQSLISVF
jgi:hypothetical protein